MPRLRRASNASRLVLLLMVAACSADPGEARHGSLALDLALEKAVSIDVVNWTLTGQDMQPMQGSIDVADPNATASVEVFGLTPGDGYAIELDATSTSGETACKGSTGFAIEAGTVTSVHIMLRCTSTPRFGAVRANGKLNRCATLDKVVVSPLETSVGNAIDLTAVASDVETDGISYLWTAAGGTVADPRAPGTSFTCTDPGDHDVRVVVSDDDFDQCSDAWMVRVRCGSGVAECETDDDCDDQNVCTAETCHQGSGVCVRDPAANDGTLCGPGNGPPGDSPEDRGLCSAGACVPDANCGIAEDCPNTPSPPAVAQCTRANCTRPTSFASVCTIELDANQGMACEATGPGSADGVCSPAGECLADTDACGGTCSSDTVCRISRCNEDTGQCEEENAPASTDCSVENPPLGSCDGAGICTSNGCVSDLDCDDGNSCTNDLCSFGTGICSNAAAPDGTTCSSADPDATVCIGGECRAPACASDADCPSRNQCLEDGRCDLGTGACQAGEAVPTGTACQRFNGSPGACVEGFCGCADDSSCASTNPCRADGVCDASDGLCIDGPPINEGLPCDNTFGPLSGRCQEGSCVPACDVTCADDGNDCIERQCSVTDGSCVRTAFPRNRVCVSDGEIGLCDGMGTCEPPPACAIDGCPESEIACVRNRCDLDVRGCVGENEPAGASCTTPGSNPGVCDGDGTCIAIDLCPVGEPQEREVTVACTNSVNPAQSPFPYTLRVTPTTPIEAGEVFTVDLAGIAIVPEFFLDAAQGVVPGGVREAILEDAVATVAVRSGATGPNVALRADGTAIAPGPTRFCTVVVDLACTSDEDCPVGPCRDPVNVLELPTSDDCSPGGACDMAGKLQTQCEPNGFCVTGDAPIPLATEPGTFTADAEGLVRFGWAENVPGESVCPTSNDLRCVSNSPTGFIPNEGLILPRPPYASSAEPIGIRVNVNNALFVPLQCTMVEQGGLCQGNPIQGCPFPATFPSECDGAQCIFGADIVFTRGDELLLNCAIE